MAPQKKSAFTLIELIIVITIIGILTSVLLFDFNGAKDRQELGLIADQAIAMLQQAHADVASGKVRMDDGEAAVANVFLCEGGYFKVGEVPQFVTADYVDGECSAETLVLENYGLKPGGAYLGEISIGESAPGDVYVLFEPPEGDVSFNSGAYTRDARFDFVHDNVEDLMIALGLTEATGQTAILTNPDEK